MMLIFIVSLMVGLLDSEPLREADEDLASEGNYPILTEEEREEIHQELDKVLKSQYQTGL